MGSDQLPNHNTHLSSCPLLLFFMLSVIPSSLFISITPVFLFLSFSPVCTSSILSVDC